ncbi:uncharacterized protein MONBRDRAFT_28723 [Monosiga brevicollis MX1]|uniref:Uncharacterized protein n=1 Tax=Monosiga brevicollis TaxID=81824 RepID=A9V902_MONBE|nr:uncharacterized protein MONBRDRAFT_28723 [Monosiga brevicollis MX1]EDQ86045.1 predicted protein [Monosiga brevicollis MX1]|eukprot:XP_001749239.1 hypothetical protein [Monosiga brevicollis MX1]
MAGTRPTRQNNTLIAHPELGRSLPPEDPSIVDRRHGMTSNYIAQQHSNREALREARRQPLQFKASVPMANRDAPDSALGTRPLRGTLRTNPLIAKAPLGSSARAGVNARAQSMTHGRINVKTDSVANAMAWSRAQPEAVSALTTPASTTHSASSNGSTGRGLDYVAMNKLALRHGLTSAKDQLALRQSHRLERKSSTNNTTPGRRLRGPTVQDASQPAGATNRFDGSVGELMSFEPQRQYLLQRQASEAQHRQEVRESRRVGIPTTKTVLLRQKMRSPPPSAPWKMSRFEKNAQPAISSFRSPRARQQALERHQFESVDRMGTLGQGLHAATL